MRTWDKDRNLVLTGMPGAGKSTAGVVVAKRLGYRFVDSDLEIQEETGRLLQELIEEQGIEGFWKLESRINVRLAAEKKSCVIATGGSVCYEPEAMRALAETGTIVYLRLSYDCLRERLGDLNARGVTLKPGQTLAELYRERLPLYEKYADIVVDCEKLTLREVAVETEKLFLAGLISERK